MPLQKNQVRVAFPQGEKPTYDAGARALFPSSEVCKRKLRESWENNIKEPRGMWLWRVQQRVALPDLRGRVARLVGCAVLPPIGAESAWLSGRGGSRADGRGV